MAKLRLQQGQVWKQGDRYLRITRLERLAVEYKTTTSPVPKGGALHQATKKEFCRLLKGAVLQPATPSPQPEATLPPGLPARHQRD